MTTSNTAEEANTGEYDVEHNVGPENECTGEGTSFSTTADNTVNIGDSSGGSSQNSADTSTDNNEEKHSAVEASNSGATTSDTGNNDDTVGSESKRKKHKIKKKKSKHMNTIWNVITNYGICWITPQQYQHQEDELAFTEGKL